MLWGAYMKGRVTPFPYLFYRRNDYTNFMVLITKEEKDLILKQYPNINIVRTVKQKSGRHRYYMEEAKGAMALLDRIRHPERKLQRQQERKDRYRNDRNRQRNRSPRDYDRDRRDGK